MLLTLIILGFAILLLGFPRIYIRILSGFSFDFDFDFDFDSIRLEFGLITARVALVALQEVPRRSLGGP